MITNSEEPLLRYDQILHLSEIRYESGEPSGYYANIPRRSSEFIAFEEGMISKDEKYMIHYFDGEPYVRISTKLDLEKSRLLFIFDMEHTKQHEKFDYYVPEGTILFTND